MKVRDTGRKSAELPEPTVTSVIGSAPEKLKAKPSKTSVQGRLPTQNGRAELLTMVIALSEIEVVVRVRKSSTNATGTTGRGSFVGPAGVL